MEAVHCAEPVLKADTVLAVLDNPHWRDETDGELNSRAVE
jgi:hypothetical protein